jgi:hypothetical protein
MLRVAAWLLLLAIMALTVVPPRLRMLTGLGRDLSTSRSSS